MLPKIETPLNPEQERAWTLASHDAEQLLSRAALIPEPLRSSFISAVELSALWFAKGVAAIAWHPSQAMDIPVDLKMSGDLSVTSSKENSNA